MEHYICTGGCGGVADSAGVCQDPDCAKRGQPLEACNCEDDQHEGRQEKKEEA